MRKIRVHKHFIFFSALILLLVFTTAGHLIFLTFYAFALVGLGSYIYLRILAEVMKIDITLEQAIFRAGDTVGWRLACESPIPVTVIFIEQFQNGKVVVQKHGSITFDENLWIDYSAPFHSRGIYDIGHVIVTASDLFGIMTLTLKRTLNVQLKIYPALYRVCAENGGNDIFLDRININARRENQYMISDIRKYVPGDSTKKIHWKVSAKLNELFVRKYESTSGVSVVILADLSHSNYDLDTTGAIEERIADTVGSFVHDAASMGINADVYLHTLQREHHQVTSIYRYNDFIERLTVTPSSAELPFYGFVTRELSGFDRMTRIFIITATRDEKLVSLIKTRYFYYDIMLIHCDDSEQGDTFHYGRLLDLKAPQLFTVAGL